MDYIAADEYADFGLTTEDASGRGVAAASALIDAHLGRPEGLIWQSDASGRPCMMARAAATRSWELAGPIQPGGSVVAQFNNPPSAALLGAALVLDADDDDTREAVVVTAINGLSVTFGTVTYAHEAEAPAQSGLVISERRLIGFQAPVAFLSRSPVARVVALGSRWDSSSRREPALSDPRHDYAGMFATGIGVAPIGGSAPQWSLMDEALIDCDPDSGKLLVRALAGRSEMMAAYLAGWSPSDVPAVIKQACARLAATILNQDPDLPLNAKMYRAGDTAIQRFSTSLMDEDVTGMLRPFLVKRGL